MNKNFDNNFVVRQCAILTVNKERHTMQEVTIKKRNNEDNNQS